MPTCSRMYNSPFGVQHWSNEDPRCYFANEAGGEGGKFHESIGDMPSGIRIL